MDLGLDGLIVEAHCSPDCAWSDKAQQVTPQGLAYICRNLVIRETNATTESLTELRSQIDKLDDELLELLSRRMRATTGSSTTRAISGSTRKSTTCPCCRRSATGNC